MYDRKSFLKTLDVIKGFYNDVAEAAAPTYGMDAVRRAFHKNKTAPHSDGNTSSNAHNELAHYHMNKAGEAKSKEAKKLTMMHLMLMLKLKVIPLKQIL